MALAKSRVLPEPQFSHLSNGNDLSCLAGLLGGWDVTYHKAPGPVPSSQELFVKWESCDYNFHQAVDIFKQVNGHVLLFP